MERNAIHFSSEHLESPLLVIFSRQGTKLSAVDGKAAACISFARKADCQASPQKRRIRDRNRHLHLNIKSTVGRLNRPCRSDEIGDASTCRICLAADAPVARSILLRTVSAARPSRHPSGIVHRGRHCYIRIMYYYAPHRRKPNIGSKQHQREQ